MAIKTGKKIAVADIFCRRGRLMSRLMLQESTHESTSVATARKWVSATFGLKLQGSTHGGRLMPGGRLMRVDSQGVPISSLPWVDSRVDSWFSNMHNFQNTSPKIIKFSPMDHKSFVLSLDAFKSGFDKIMILPLKSNKSFSSENH